MASQDWILFQRAQIRERALTTTTIEFKLTQQVTFDESLLCLIRTPFFLYLITSILLPEVTEQSRSLKQCAIDANDVIILIALSGSVTR